MAGKDNMQSEALKNLEALRANPYPGRGIVIGMDEKGENLIQVYWIMGRSANSRNRVFAKNDSGRVFTEAADPTKVKDPSLIIYNAMREDRNKIYYVVSNGDQTDTVMDKYATDRRSLGTTLLRRQYEPDAPNFTPRITALLDRGCCCIAQVSILRKSRSDDSCERITFEYESFAPGFGFCVTTYLGDGDPLPSFRGEPYPVPLAGDAEEITRTYWDALDPENRVSLAVKTIHIKTGVSSVCLQNKYEKVATTA
jgi:IMP cyclohydrolase